MLKGRKPAQARTAAALVLSEGGPSTDAFTTVVIATVVATALVIATVVATAVVITVIVVGAATRAHS